MDNAMIHAALYIVSTIVVLYAILFVILLIASIFQRLLSYIEDHKKDLNFDTSDLKAIIICVAVAAFIVFFIHLPRLF
jgi:hypothetical protein